MTRAILGALLLATIAPWVVVHGRKYMKEKPENFKFCSIKTSDFDLCYKANLKALLAQWNHGIPGLPSAGTFEPVTVKRLKIVDNQLNIELKNITIRGLGATNLTKVVHNLKDFSFRIRAHVPKFRIDAHYATEGRLLFLPLNGNGKMWVESENATLSLLIHVRLRDDFDSGYTFVDIQSVQAKIRRIASFRVNLENLFNGNKQLEAHTNAMFNENWRDFLEVLKPTLESTIAKIIYARFKKVFNYIPANYFISDVPSERQFYAQ